MGVREERTEENTCQNDEKQGLQSTGTLEMRGRYIGHMVVMKEVD